MNNKIYETAKFLALGILIGYFGKYALNWVKTWKADSKNQENQKETQSTQKQN